MRLTGVVETDDFGRSTVTIAAVPGRPSNYQSGLRVFLEWFLGESLESYVQRKRAEDPPRSWRGIAEDMSRDVEQTAARLHPNGTGLTIVISHTLPMRISEADDVDPES